jgi:hemin uptake protein HemP
MEGRLDLAEFERLVALGDCVESERMDWVRDAMQRDNGPREMNTSEENRPQTTPDAQPVHDAIALTEGGNRAHILYDGKVYTLSITRSGKLILTK